MPVELSKSEILLTSNRWNMIDYPNRELEKARSSLTHIQKLFLLRLLFLIFLFFFGSIFSLLGIPPLVEYVCVAMRLVINLFRIVRCSLRVQLVSRYFLCRHNFTVNLGAHRSLTLRCQYHRLLECCTVIVRSPTFCFFIATSSSIFYNHLHILLAYFLLAFQHAHSVEQWNFHQPI